MVVPGGFLFVTLCSAFTHLSSQQSDHLQFLHSRFLLIYRKSFHATLPTKFGLTSRALGLPICDKMWQIKILFFQRRREAFYGMVSMKFTHFKLAIAPRVSCAPCEFRGSCVLDATLANKMATARLVYWTTGVQEGIMEHLGHIDGYSHYSSIAFRLTIGLAEQGMYLNKCKSKTCLTTATAGFLAKKLVSTQQDETVSIFQTIRRGN